MRKINEIFYSLQGEGAMSGTAAVFVRFSGCNLHCSFCDTKHEQGTLLSDSEIVDYINTYPAEWIILTGGEPSLFIDADFIHTLHVATGKKIAIETNGTHIVDDEIDWITLSPKRGMTDSSTSSMAENIVVQRADEIKVVDIGQNLDEYFAMPQARSNTRMYLQPCFVSNEAEYRHNIERTVRRVKEDPRWTLSVQMHRFLNIP